jgi:tetratricopeptide (TPR) repeat protein
LLFGITLWLFWPATGYDLLNLDDDRYVWGNQMVSQGLSLEGIRWAFRSVYESCWLPVLWLSYMLDASVFGPQPFGYHLTNVLLHALNAALVFLLLWSWTGKFWPSVFVAAFFAWHPLRVESVAWVAERKDVLSGFWFLLCLFSYRRFTQNPKSGYEVPAVLFMALGLMTKPMLVTLPFLLLLLDYWPLGRLKLNWASIKSLVSEKALFWGLALLFCYITYYAQKVGGAVHSADASPLVDRLLAIPAAYLFYIEKTVLPVHLSMIYGDLEITRLQLLTDVLLLAGMTIAALWIGRRCRAVPVGWFWFLGMLVPTIGLIRFGIAQVADRFTYLPSIGLGICVAWGAACMVPERRWRTPLMWCLGLAILAGCAWQTRRVLPNWTNSITAFENVLRYLPDDTLSNNNYGEALLAAGRTEDALRHFEKAAYIEPQTTPFAANAALALIILQRTDEAIARLEKAMMEIDAESPFLNFALGIGWMEAGKADKAIPFLIKANGSHMARLAWRVELARAYLEAGRESEATREFARLAQLGWGQLADFEGLCNYYAMLWEKGPGRRAWSFFERALAKQPNNISLLNNVAWLLATDPPPGVSSDEAIHLALRAKELCGIAPPGVLDTLAAAYAADGNFDQAIQWSEQARALAMSSGQTNLASRIEARTHAYQEGMAWGRNGPAKR